MKSLAKVTILGILAEDPVIWDMKDGRKRAGLSVFTLRPRHNAEGHDLPDEKEWHRIVIINQRLAAYAEAHLTEEDQVHLEGELHTNFSRSETYGLQSLTEILLEHDSDKLMQLADVPGCDEAGTTLCMPVAAGGGQFGEARLDHQWFGCVA